MAGANLLALIDDIATILDDVAVLSKVAAKKTAGVLGDDLALNAEQVSGVKASRELPVVWAVTKGSLWNKVILVPASLLISAVYPPLITILMIIGGLYLCYEGIEKITHKFFHSSEELKAEHKQKLEAIANPNVNLVELEKEKIKGAIRTDFILSAEIVVIILGTVQAAPFMTQVAVLTTLAFALTICVYGLVATIVRLDDAGLYLLRKSLSGSFQGLTRLCGRALLHGAPLLMKTLSIVGTIAMFLVGGGIIVHNIAPIHHFTSELITHLGESLGKIAQSVGPIILEGLVGVVAGIIVLVLVVIAKKGKQSFSTEN